jgi:hypothetical protein
MKCLSKYHLKNGVVCLFALVLFSSCTTSNKFAASFGKRKYNKGYYVDVPDKAPKVAANLTTATQSDNTTKDLESTSTTLSAPENHLDVKAAPVMQPVSAKPSVKAKPIQTTVSVAPAKVAESVKGDGGGRHSDSGSSDDRSFGVNGFLFVVLGYLLALIAAIIAAVVGFLTGGVGAFATGILIVALLAYIAGIVFCVLSLIHDEQKKGWAIAGLILAGIPLLLFLIGIVAVGI